MTNGTPHTTTTTTCRERITVRSLRPGDTYREVGDPTLETYTVTGISCDREGYYLEVTVDRTGRSTTKGYGRNANIIRFAD